MRLPRRGPLSLAIALLAAGAIATPAGGNGDHSGKGTSGPPKKAVETGVSPETAKKEFDIQGLVDRLKSTKAIGFFTKLALKNQIDDLLGKLRCYHARACDTSLATLNEEFNLLLMKVLTLMQDDDPDLFQTLAGGREILWKNLTDPTAFAKLDGRAS